MKTFKEFLTPIVYAVGVVILASISSCSDKAKTNELETERVQKMLTSSPWKLTAVTVDGVDKMTLFNGLTLAFTSSSFTTAHGEPVWPAAGTWKFTDDTATVVERSDGVMINVEVVAKKLTLRLNWTKTTLGGGKQSSVAGQHVFTFLQ